MPGFTKSEFALAEGQTSGTLAYRAVYNYNSDDAIATVAASGYFDPVGSPLNDTDGTDELNNGDIIRVWAGIGGTTLYDEYIVSNDGKDTNAVTVATLLAAPVGY